MPNAPKSVIRENPVTTKSRLVRSKEVYSPIKLMTETILTFGIPIIKLFLLFNCFKNGGLFFSCFNYSRLFRDRFVILPIFKRILATVLILYF